MTHTHLRSTRRPLPDGYTSTAPFVIGLSLGSVLSLRGSILSYARRPPPDAYPWPEAYRSTASRRRDAGQQKSRRPGWARRLLVEHMKRKFRPWQAWQRPTLARLKTNYHWRWEV